jgi:hypothetical protein
MLTMSSFITPRLASDTSGIGGAEQDVLQIGGQHGPAPAVGQRGPDALLHQVFVILIHPHVGAVHDFDDFTVDVARQDTLLFPDFVARRRRSLQVFDSPSALPHSLSAFSATSRAISSMSRS